MSELEKAIRMYTTRFLEELREKIEIQMWESVGEEMGRLLITRKRLEAVDGLGKRKLGNERRSKREVQEQCLVLLEHVRKHPNLGAEQLSRLVGAPGRDLALLLKRLVEDRRVLRRGSGKKTTYRAAAGR
jgi:hypothetical protein